MPRTGRWQIAFRRAFERQHVTREQARRDRQSWARLEREQEPHTRQLRWWRWTGWWPF